MKFRTIYHDAIGSAGETNLLRLLTRTTRSGSLPRVLSFVKTFVINGRLRNAIKRQIHQDLFHPKSLIVEPTYQCNQHCRDCYITRTDEVMAPELFASLVDQAASLGVYRFVLMGGEPTLPESITSILPTIQRKTNCLFTFCTNGSQINETFLRSFKRVRNVAFLLSMDGSERVTVERRGADAYTTYVKAISCLKQANMLFALSMTLTPETWQEQLEERLIADYVKAGGMVLYTCPVFDREAGLYRELPKVDFLSHVHFLMKKYPLYWGDGYYGKMTTRGIILRENSQICVDPSGKVRPVRFYSEPIFGDLERQSLREILASPELKAYKKQSRIKSADMLNDEKAALAHQRFKIFNTDSTA